MKTRNGFVSNSSSSSFLIYLPKDFKISDEEIKEIYEWNFGDEAPEGFKDLFDHCFNILKNNGRIHEIENYRGFQTLQLILKQHNLVIFEFENGPDRGEIRIISDEIIKKIKELPV